MEDYRNNLKRILKNTAGDDKSLKNSLAAIKMVLNLSDSDKVNKFDNTNSSLQIDKNIINSLLSSLTLLINEPGNKKAKLSATKAINQLTFEPGIGKKYGKQLGKLDLAIQSSAETQAVKDTKIFKKAVSIDPATVRKTKRNGNNYTVIRLLSGADLINEHGNTVYTLVESQVHPLNLKSGDIVEAAVSDNPNFEADVLRVSGYRKLRKRDFDQIEDFRYAVVQKLSGNYYVSRNIKGEKLKINGKNITFKVDPSYYQSDTQIEDGSIVDLAWYSKDVRLKKHPQDAITVRWIYQTEQISKANIHKKNNKKKTATEDNIEYLDFDLHYQRVGIAVGDNQNEAILEGIVSKYNGIPIPIDAFEGKKKVIEKQIRNLDIVILVTAYAAHDSTWNIREFTSKYGVKFAASSSKGYQSFERALYRAHKGLPAYEGNQSIDYKYKA